MARRQRHHDYRGDGDDDDDEHEHQPSSMAGQARQAARADRASTTGRTGQARRAGQGRQGTRLVATRCSLAQHAIRLATGRSFSTHGPPQCWPATARRSSMAVFHASCALSTPAASGSCTHSCHPPPPTAHRPLPTALDDAHQQPAPSVRTNVRTSNRTKCLQPRPACLPACLLLHRHRHRHHGRFAQTLLSCSSVSATPTVLTALPGGPTPASSTTPEPPLAATPADNQT
ncbi:hypothetical protein COCVIDRAFT_14050 [Bipolaris victoriae FI3]|uniref:Uncharacterized protein n=1 Tax=Bipolaris victoriae (strain FI3) TaxID=930091 RepID=W7ETK0_BIPV3|nr:hypothetical protein COCVIDRAFT_14050 [Bipolaris victoriae FI3]